jgi:hypothetical protein
MAEVVESMQPETTGAKVTTFKAGAEWTGNRNGRPKGSRNKLGEDFIQALQESFNQHGAATIETVRQERPHEYLKVVASILPKELNVRTGALDEMSDDDLASMLATIRSAVLAGAFKALGDGSEEAARH